MDRVAYNRYVKGEITPSSPYLETGSYRDERFLKDDMCHTMYSLENPDDMLEDFYRLQEFLRGKLEFDGYTYAITEHNIKKLNDAMEEWREFND